VSPPKETNNKINTAKSSDGTIVKAGPIVKREKVILHIDGDAFFVGVEIAKNPKLRGLPVVTGEERGIVSALSYEAKALGITRGMPIFRVKREFPKVKILPGDYHSYVEYSTKMFDIVRRYVDDVEEYSIDECFGELTGLDKPLGMSYRQIAERIKKEVNEELDLSVSIGLAPTKVLAKVASNWVKPNGLTVIESALAVDFLQKVPIKKIWGIGPRTAELLNRKDIMTAKDFYDKDIAWIKLILSKPYETIWQELHGISVMEIDSAPKTVYSSVQKTRSFHPSTNDKTFLWSQLSKHIEDSCRKARHFNLVPRKFSIFLKTKDFEFVTALILLPSPSNSPEILLPLAHAHFENIHKKGVLYRTTGVTLLDLMADFVPQDDLFGSNAQASKFETIHKQIDLLEEKFGKIVIYLGSTKNAIDHKAQDGGTDSEDLDKNLLFL
jgi:DNA polymerase-4/DNA polymerase V